MNPPRRTGRLFAVLGILVVAIVAFVLARVGGVADTGKLSEVGVADAALELAVELTDRTVRAVDDMIDATSRAAEPLIARLRVEEPAKAAAAEPEAPPARPARRPAVPRPAKPAEPVQEIQPEEVAPIETAASPVDDDVPVAAKAGPAVVPLATAAVPLAVIETVVSPSADAEDAVYTAGDADIVPPRAVRRTFASQPPAGVDPAALGEVLLVIDELGQVESVKLVRDSGRFQDRMMLSIIKAWRFEPALRDGRPVKFQLSMLLVP